MPPRKKCSTFKFACVAILCSSVQGKSVAIFTNNSNNQRRNNIKPKHRLRAARKIDFLRHNRKRSKGKWRLRLHSTDCPLYHLVVQWRSSHLFWHDDKHVVQGWDYSEYVHDKAYGRPASKQAVPIWNFCSHHKPWFSAAVPFIQNWHLGWWVDFRRNEFDMRKRQNTKSFVAALKLGSWRFNDARSPVARCT